MRLLVRADATPEVGAGHVMRCAALAESWIAVGVGDVIVAGDVTLPFVQHRLQQLGVKVDRAAAQSGADVLLVDSYDERVRHEPPDGPAALRVLVDDLGANADRFDVVWNPNAYRADMLYVGFTGEVISQLVPLRGGLPVWSPQSGTVAVSLGGTTPSPTLVEAIDACAVAMRRTIVASSAAWIPAHWQRASADDMWSSFADCEFMLTAGGSTVWEAAHVGIPIAVLLAAPNQQLVGEWVRAQGAPVLDVSASMNRGALIAGISRCMQEARALTRIENGAVEVATRLRDMALELTTSQRRVVLRPADMGDAEVLWKWANDPETRRSASDRPVVPWENHLAWLTGQLASEQVKIWIGIDGDARKIGSIRFDTRDRWTTARLSYVVDPDSRGRQLARKLVAYGTSLLLSERPDVEIWADVMDENTRSLRVFRGLGWLEAVGDRDMVRFHPTPHGFA